MGVSALDRPPGWPEPWLGLWRVSHRELVARGAWVPALKPLLDEYVRALKLADAAFEAGEGGDRHAKRALAYAVELGLTPKARKAAGGMKKDEADGNKDPFGALDEGDELAKRRAKAS